MVRTQTDAMDAMLHTTAPTALWIDYWNDSRGTVLAATVNGTTTVERLPGESMDDLDARALVAAQGTGSRIVRLNWGSRRGRSALDCSS